jgi:hypothetical protein
MPAGCRGTTASNRAQYFPMGPMEPTEVAVDETIALRAQSPQSCTPQPQTQPGLVFGRARQPARWEKTARHSPRAEREIYSVKFNNPDV